MLWRRLRLTALAKWFSWPIRRRVSCDRTIPLWQSSPMNRADEPVTAIKSSTAEDALVTRPDMEVEVRLLPPGNATFLSSLISGEPLAVAASKALCETPSFDFRPASLA